MFKLGDKIIEIRSKKIYTFEYYRKDRENSFKCENDAYLISVIEIKEFYVDYRDFVTIKEYRKQKIKKINETR